MERRAVIAAAHTVNRPNRQVYEAKKDTNNTDRDLYTGVFRGSIAGEVTKLEMKVKANLVLGISVPVWWWEGTGTRHQVVYHSFIFTTAIFTPGKYNSLKSNKVEYCR